MPATTESLDDARAALARGEADRALDIAAQLLEQQPDSREGLEVAVTAAIDTADERAVDLARRLLALEATAMAHRSLGFALMAEGDVDEAATALQQALELDPHDTAAAVSLGHLRRMRGHEREATELLERAAAVDPDNAEVVSNLVDLHWIAGRLRKAITWAERLVELTPDDPLALLDLAELSMELNEHDIAVEVFARIREVDREPGRRIFPLHGMIEAHIRAGQLRRALDLTITATEVDREGLTTDAMSYLVGEVFGEADRPTPHREALLEDFAAERTRFRHVLDDSGVM